MLPLCLSDVLARYIKEGLVAKDWIIFDELALQRQMAGGL